jgi:hypothetical protein
MILKDLLDFDRMKVVGDWGWVHGEAALRNCACVRSRRPERLAASGLTVSGVAASASTGIVL